MRKLFTLLALLIPFAAFGQAPVNVPGAPTITIAGATATTTGVNSYGAHEASVVWKFGGVVGSYSGCTVQAQTSVDGGAKFLNFGTAVPITVTSNAAPQWTLTESASATPSTTTSGAFGSTTNFVFACNSYGTSAPSTIKVTLTPGTSTVNVNQQSSGGVTLVPDVCNTNTKHSSTFSFASATAQQIIAPSAGLKNTACLVKFEAGATAEIGNIWEGTQGSAPCDTSTVALEGSTTAANGTGLAANGGYVMGSGASAVLLGLTANSQMCAKTSGSNQVTVTIVWVHNP